LLENKARLVKLDEGRLEVFLPDSGLKSANELAKEIELSLTQLAGAPWKVVLASTRVPAAETLVETRARVQASRLQIAREHAAVQRVLGAFPGADVVDVMDEEGDPR
jgi:DNA polymerase-3 subunit gamma/tau